MARPRLELGTWGKITRTEAAPKRWRARARYRGFDGKTVQCEAWGRSGAEAERRLLADLRERSQFVSDSVTREMRVTALGKMWLEEIATSNLADQTVQKYDDIFTDYVEPALGQLAVREATVSILDRFLKQLAETRPAVAKQAKVVLAGMFGLAVRHDALQHNPVRETKLPARKRPPVRALTLDEVQALRRGVQEWQAASHMGPKRAPDLLDVVDMMLATGARIGELCAIRWDDIDLGAVKPTVTISGTVIRVKSKGLTRQAHTKTSTGYRKLTLPRFAVEMLMRRQVEAIPNRWNVVFPSSTGTLRDPHNLRRQFRDARADCGFEWVTPHVFRKTVATLVDRGSDTETAAALLGHSGTAVTHAHYVQRLHEAPDMSELLEAFGRDGSTIQKDG